MLYSYTSALSPFQLVAHPSGDFGLCAVEPVAKGRAGVAYKGTPLGTTRAQPFKTDLEVTLRGNLIGSYRVTFYIPTARTAGVSTARRSFM
jgi:hypothetical protein